MSEVDVPEAHDSLPGYPAPAMTETVHGHDEHEAFLTRAYRSGKLHHALIFSGRQGIGKATFAFQFARYIVENPDPSSAPEQFGTKKNQSVARQMASGAHPQLLHLTRPMDAKTGKFRTQLTIEETKRIGRFLTRTVADSGYRVVIVDPVNDMNASAANALLKNLEEPTPRTVFILVSHASGRLLPTIRSRCLIVPFHPLEAQPMRETLTDLGIAERIHGAELETLLSLAEGSPRLAAMLADGGGLEIMKAADAVVSNRKFDLTAAMKIGDALGGRDSETLFELFIDQMMNQLAIRAHSAASANPRHAGLLAVIHQRLTLKIAEAIRYNLDRKQLVCAVLQQLNDASTGAAAG